MNIYNNMLGCMYKQFTSIVNLYYMALISVVSAWKLEVP